MIGVQSLIRIPGCKTTVLIQVLQFMGFCSCLDKPNHIQNNMYFNMFWNTKFSNERIRKIYFVTPYKNVCNILFIYYKHVINFNWYINIGLNVLKHIYFLMSVLESNFFFYKITSFRTFMYSNKRVRNNVFKDGWMF